MAFVKVQSFLTIERSMVLAILNPWLEEVGRPTAQRIEFNVRRGEYAAAFQVARRITLNTAQEHLGRVDLLGHAAVLVGESFWNEGRALGDVGSGREPLAIQVPLVTQALARNLMFDGARQIQQSAEDQIAKEQTLAQQVQLAEELSLVERINKSVMGKGTRVVEAGANLTTSRLVAFGALSEAQSQGQGGYQISEILDSVTCPVCRRMHGRTFGVDENMDQLTQQLSAQDPLELKGAYPFPRQSRDGIKELTSMTDEEVFNRGWARPPFHPSCRGIIVPVGTVPASEIISFSPLLAGVSIADQLAGSLP